MANTKAQSKASKRVRPKSFILMLALVLLVGYFVITFIGLRLDIGERNAIKDQKNEAHQQMKEENAELQAIVDSEDKGAYMEEVARDELGYVMPDEKVFYDVTPGA